MNPPRLTFDQDLRSVPDDVGEVETYIAYLHARLPKGPLQKVKAEGEIAVYLRILGRFAEAEGLLRECLKTVESEHLGVRVQVQQLLRLAHVFQEQKRFQESNRLFCDVLDICRNDPEAMDFLHFACQHAAKNLFDQHHYSEALTLFREALAIRQSKNLPQDQLDSTLFAIAETEKRLDP